MRASDVPTSNHLEDHLESLDIRIPHHTTVEDVEALPRAGRWAVGLGSIHQPEQAVDGAPPMLFAMLVVIDVIGYVVRFANPLPSGRFRIETLFRYLSTAMRNPVQGESSCPDTIIFPQSNVADLYRPFLLKLGVSVEIGAARGFGPVFDAILGDLA